MTVPTIGKTRGIFEIFVPGVFLLLNFIVFIYLFPFIDSQTLKQIESLLSNQALSLMVIIVFGYLVGIILRLTRTDVVDKYASWYLRKRDPNARQENENNLYAYEEFPYIGWLGVGCHRSFPQSAVDFYNRIWAKGTARFTEEEYKNFLQHFPDAEKVLTPMIDRMTGKVYIDLDKISESQRQELGEAFHKLKTAIRRGDKRFFNFCKVMIASSDDKSANEVDAAEALSRYTSEMFYALSLSTLLLVMIIFLRIVILHDLNIVLLIISLGYAIAIERILRTFRFIRIKEVEAVFTASFKNRSVFENTSKESM